MWGMLHDRLDEAAKGCSLNRGGKGAAEWGEGGYVQRLRGFLLKLQVENKLNSHGSQPISQARKKSSYPPKYGSKTSQEINTEKRKLTLASILCTPVKKDRLQVKYESSNASKTIRITQKPAGNAKTQLLPGFCQVAPSPFVKEKFKLPSIPKRTSANKL